MSGMIRNMFRLQFDSAEALHQAFTSTENEVGIFFHTGRDLPLGERVVIKALVDSLPAPVYLEGMVAWRRLRPRGTTLPRGLFVALDEQDRRRLNETVSFLSQSAKHKGVREHPRYPVFTQAHYRTERGVHPAQTRDISKGGAFLQVRGPLLPVGSKTEITLNLRGHKHENIELLAEVVRFEPFAGNPGLAVRFKPGQHALKRLAGFLDEIQRDLNFSTVTFSKAAIPA